MDDKVVKRVVFAGIMLMVSIALSIVSWMILPDYVSTQFRGFSTGAVALPKILAVLIAFGFSVAFSILSIRQEEAVKYSFIGIGLHILYWICNL